MKIEIGNGRVIDPKNGVDRSKASLTIADGSVAGIGEVPPGFVADQRIDATGCVVCPGLIDLAALTAGTRSETEQNALTPEYFAALP